MGRLEAEKLRWTGTGAADDGGGDDARAAASAPTPTRELRARFDLRGLVLAPPPQEQREADAPRGRRPRALPPLGGAGGD